MGSKAVVLGDSSPVGIDHGGPLIHGTDAIHPVVFVSKTSPRPPEVGNACSFQGIHHIVPDSPGICDFRILSYPVPSINATSQVF